jgi:tetratricopeptide (TPR) repeat protein
MLSTTSTKKQIPSSNSPAPLQICLRLFNPIITLLLLASPLAAERKQVPKEIIKRAGDAIVRVQLVLKETNTFFSYSGIFINDKGLAVIPLKAMTYHTLPIFRDAKGEVIPFKKIRAINPDLMLAIVELSPQSNSCLKFSERKAEMWEPTALIWDKITSRGVRSGPFLAHRQLLSKGPGSLHYLSLGMYFNNRGRPGTWSDRGILGAAVINSNGDLIGTFSITNFTSPGFPLRALALPTGPIRELLETAESNPKGLPFPLKENNPHDAAYWDYTLSPLTVARDSMQKTPQTQERIEEETIKQCKKIAKKYPDSIWAKSHVALALGRRAYRKAGALMAEDAEGGAPSVAEMAVITASFQEVADAYKTDEKNMALQNALRFEVAAMSLRHAGETEKLIACHETELKKWGDSPAPGLLGALALSYQEAGKLEAAADTYERLVKIAPDSINRLYDYQKVLFQLNRPGDTAKKLRVSELIDKLEDAYRPRR